MAELLSVSTIKVVDELTLIKCDGICLSSLLRTIENKIDDFIEDGYDFKVKYKIDRQSFFGTPFEFSGCVSDNCITDDVFGHKQENPFNKFKRKLLSDIESVYNSFKYKPRYTADLHVEFINQDDTKVTLDFCFDLVLSYAYYMYFTKGDSDYEYMLEVVHECWEGIENKNNVNYLPSLWIPKKTLTEKREERMKQVWNFGYIGYASYREHLRTGKPRLTVGDLCMETTKHD